MFKELYKSFKNAFLGFKKAIVTQRNIRIHIVAVFFVILFSILYELELFFYPVIFIFFSIVIFSELLNTSIELLADKQETNYSIYIKSVKDISAAAVLVNTVFATVSALIIYSKLHNLIGVFLKLYNCPIYILFLILYIILSFLFIKGVKK